MSSDLVVFDSTFFTDPFFPFSDSSIDILQSIPISFPDKFQENSFDQIATTTLLCSSPPGHQLENISLSLTNHMGIPSNSTNGFDDYSAFEVKTEECQIPIYSTHDYYNLDSNSSFLPHSYGGSDNAVKMMQRSFSSNCFDGNPNLLFQPRFGCHMESSPSSFHSSSTPHVLTSPENCISSCGQMRRVCSTGDLQNMKTSQRSQRLSSSPFATESSFMEEANSKVGKYSAEERKERIHRYKAKRTQRNFNKTIKYACRKTLADNRPRIRGRFARNDEPGETPKAFTNNRYEEDDELWIESFHDEEDERRTIEKRVQVFNTSYGTSHQFQYYGYS